MRRLLSLVCTLCLLAACGPDAPSPDPTAGMVLPPDFDYPARPAPDFLLSTPLFRRVRLTNSLSDRRTPTPPSDDPSRQFDYLLPNTVLADRMDNARDPAGEGPVATGVIEGICRHRGKDRQEASGRRWSIAGAEEGFSASEPGGTNWGLDASHRRRRKTRHHRLYRRSLETTDTLEEQMGRRAV